MSEGWRLWVDWRDSGAHFLFETELHQWFSAPVFQACPKNIPNVRMFSQTRLFQHPVCQHMWYIHCSHNLTRSLCFLHSGSLKFSLHKAFYTFMILITEITDTCNSLRNTSRTNKSHQIRMTNIFSPSDSFRKL